MRKKRESFSENIKGGRKNVYWQVDLLVSKLEDGTRFNVLLAIDAFSRYITCLKAMKEATVENVVTALERAFVKEGKPLVIVTDNGAQFCARHDGQVHAFEKFLATSGTCHLRIPRGRPQKNGIAERAVQNVKNEALRPFNDQFLSSVQQRLFRWRNWYNFPSFSFAVRWEKRLVGARFLVMLATLYRTALNVIRDTNDSSTESILLHVASQLSPRESPRYRGVLSRTTAVPPLFHPVNHL
ncbi:MAG: DDE-type integrase/transposase/recombinase [Candidatus Odinarchaeota archaeon]